MLHLDFFSDLINLYLEYIIQDILFDGSRIIIIINLYIADFIDIYIWHVNTNDMTQVTVRDLDITFNA